MKTTEELYVELKEDVGAIVNTLFDVSEAFIRKRGNFLPHGAILTEEREVKLIAAAPPSGNDLTNSKEILPVLHDGLRQQCHALSVKAIGVAENVTITLRDNNSTEAIKVLFEHRRGLTVALYLPFEKKLLSNYTFGSAFTVPANPEVNAWHRNEA